MRSVIPVVAGVIVHYLPKPRVLLRYRDTDESPEAEQNWEFPGGRIRYGEEPGQAIEREIREELGINVSVLRLLHAQSNIYSSKKHYLVLYYECQALVAAAPDNCRWVPLDDLEELPVLPGTREAARTLKSK